MRGFFSLDGPLYSFLSKMADFLILNVLFIVCSLPVFTIGASYTAMSYVTLKMKEGDEGYVFKSFFKSFKENFRQGTGMWMICLAVGFVLGIDLYILHNGEGTYVSVMKVAVLAALVVWFMVVSWAFPLLSRFVNTVKVTLHNALLLSMGNAPRALAFTFVCFASVYVTLYNAQTLSIGLLLWLMFGFSVLSFLNSSLQYKQFKMLMPEEKQEITSDMDFRIGDETIDPADTDPDKTE